MSNTVVLELGVVEGDLKDRVWDAYNHKVNDFPNSPVLKALEEATLGYRIVGGNFYTHILLAEVFEGLGLEYPTPADMDSVFREGGFSSHPEDLSALTALVLRDEDEPNQYLGIDLRRQIERRQRFEYPIVIPLSSLRLRKDDNAPDGLGFVLKPAARIIPAPVFKPVTDLVTYFDSSDVDSETGLPTVLKDSGDRKMYLESEGLFGLSNMEGDICAIYEDLSFEDRDHADQELEEDSWKVLALRE